MDCERRYVLFTLPARSIGRVINTAALIVYFGTVKLIIL